ncbi:MAG: rhodanese-like domain-containing protein [Balneolaceae bacterium]
MSDWKSTVESNPGVIIDVRTRGEFEQGHLAEAAHQYDLLSGEFQEMIDSLDPDETYYLYCRTGNRSGQAEQMLRERGFTNVHNIGGYEELVEAGFESAQ